MFKKFKVKAAQLLAILLAVVLLSSLQGCLPYMVYDLLQQDQTSIQQPPPPTTYNTTGQYDNLSYDELCQVFFEHEVTGDNLSLNQCVADPAAMGIDVPRPATLGDYSYEATQADNQFYSEILEALSGGHTINIASLNEQQKREATYMETVLQQTLSFEEFYYYDEPLSPSTGAQAQLPLALMDYSFRTVDDIDIYLELLQDFPRYFDQLLAFEQAKKDQGLLMPREAIDDTITEAQAYTGTGGEHILADTFNEMIDKAVADATAEDGTASSGATGSGAPGGQASSDIASLTPEQIQAYKNQNVEELDTFVIPAYESLIAGLQELEPYTANGTRLYDYARGTQYYELTMESMGFNETPTEAISTLDNALQEDWNELRNSNYSPSDASLANAVQAIGDTPEAYVEYVRQHSTADFAGIKDLNYTIKVAPDASPNDYAMAYFMIPPVDDPQQNNIVFFPKNISDDVDLYNTIAHEGYPGHMYQFFAFNLQDPSNIGKLLGSLAYVEGWAMYVEGFAMSYLDADSGAIDAYNAYERFSYGLQARVDLGVNYQGWTLSDTQNYLSQWGLDSAAQGIFTVCIQQPTAYLPYGLGIIEFMNLQDQAQQVLGSSYDSLAFHQELTSLGPVSFDMLETEMNNWLVAMDAQQT